MNGAHGRPEVRARYGHTGADWAGGWIDAGYAGWRSDGEEDAIALHSADGDKDVSGRCACWDGHVEVSCRPVCSSRRLDAVESDGTAALSCPEIGTVDG